MNKVYKLVWSRVQNCYVAVSEMAKSHTKSPKSGMIGKTLIAGVLACVLSSGVTVPAFAAIVQGDTTPVTGGEVWSYLHGDSAINASVDSNWTESFNPTSIYKYLSGETIVLGLGAKASNGVGGQDTYINQYGASLGSGDSMGAVAIGLKAYADPQSVAIGMNTTANGIAIGKGSTATNNGIALWGGTADGGLAIGGYSESKGGIAIAGGKNGYSTAGERGIAIGRNYASVESLETPLDYDTSYSAQIAVGHGNYAKNGNTIAIGRDNQILGDFSGALGIYNTIHGNHSFVVGDYVSVTGNDTVVLGGGFQSRNVDTGVIYYRTGSDEAYNVKKVTGNRSVVLGVGSDGSMDDVVSVGNSKNFRRIVYVSSGETAQDAATVGQTIELVAGDNVTVTADGSNDIGQKKFKISSTAAGKSYTGGKGIVISNNEIATKNVVMYDADENDSVTLNGARGTKLTNLKSGELSRSSTDAVIGNQLWTTNQNVAGLQTQINTNTENISSLNVSVTSALESVSTVSTLVNTVNDLKADVSLNNLNASGRLVIKNAAENAVQEYMAGQNKLIANKIVMRPLVLNDVIADDTKADVAYVDEQLAAKADKSELDAKADISYVDKKLETKADADSVYTKVETDAKLDMKADISYVEEQLAAKADVDAVYTKDETDGLLEEKANVSALEGKVNADASNIDVEVWSKKLGIGSNDLVVNDGGTISIGGNGKYDSADSVSIAKSDGSGRVLRGVAVDPTDDSSAANVEYVNAVTEEAINGLKSSIGRVENHINKVGAQASALAGLHPFDNDGSQKWNVAAAYGGYKGEKAGAVGVFFKPSNTVMLSAGSSVGDDDNMYNVGVSVIFDKDKKGMSKVQMMKKLDDTMRVIAQQNAHMAEQDARIAQLEKAMAE